MQKRSMRILITNDDGYQAEGLKVLEDIARQFTDDVWVVAPAYQQSGKGHSITWGAPIRMKQLDEKRFAVKGTPTDAVILGIRNIMKDYPPDYVLSGVNIGANLAQAITMSGTIGAAIQGTLQGVKSFALSLATQGSDAYDWSSCTQHGADILRELMTQEWPANSFYNINFPMASLKTINGVRVLRHGRRSVVGDMVETQDPNGYPCYWVSVIHSEKDPPQDTDLWGIKNGYITVSPIHVDFTDYRVLEGLQAKLNKDF